MNPFYTIFQNQHYLYQQNNNMNNNMFIGNNQQNMYTDNLTS